MLSDQLEGEDIWGQEGSQRKKKFLIDFGEGQVVFVTGGGIFCSGG